MTTISLTDAEIFFAAQIGMMRQIEDIQRKKRSNTGETQFGAWQRHIEGALAECAFAKHLGLYWSKTSWPHPDVGDSEVRSTPRDWGDLRIKPDDPDDRKFYLLTGINGTYTIRGWIYALEGKKPEYWKRVDKDREEQFWCPQANLHPLGSENSIPAPVTEKSFDNWLDGDEPF
jgi:hypothetical protein